MPMLDRHRFFLFALALCIYCWLFSSTEAFTAEVDKETKRVQAFASLISAKAGKMDSRQIWSMIDDYKRGGTPSEYFYVEVASRLFSLKNTSDALKLCDLGMKEMPNSYQVLSLRGQIWTSVDELDRAAADLKKAAQMGQKFAPTYYRLANYYLASEDPKAALSAIDKAIALDDERGGTYHRFRAAILAQLKRFDEAAAEQRLAIKMSIYDYERVLLVHELARYQFGAEKYNDCIATLLSLGESSKLARKSLDNRSILLARCYERLGKNVQAQAALKSISMSSEHYPIAQKMLLESYKKCGQKKEYLEQERKNRDLFKEIKPL